MATGIVKLIKKLSLLLLFLSGFSYAHYQISYRNDILVLCTEVHCDNIKMSASFVGNVIQGDYSRVTVDFFFNDHKKYIVITPNTTSVNVCSLVYSIVNNTLSTAPIEVIPGKKALCNYEKQGDRLINQYRDKGIWYKEYYALRHNAYYLHFIDRDNGAEIIRTFYNNDNRLIQESIRN